MNWVKVMLFAHSDTCAISLVVCSTSTGTSAKTSPTKMPIDADERDENRNPPRQLSPPHPADDRIQTEREEERRPDIRQDQRQLTDGGADGDGDQDSEAGQ